jgi:hypothetical protein
MVLFAVVHLDPRRMMAFSGATSQCEERGFQRSAGTNFAIAVVTADTKSFSLLWSLISESRVFLAPLELGTVDPDAMQNESLRATADFPFLTPTLLAGRTHRFTTLSRTLAASNR